ncbi:RNA polymerase II mediator complex subunit [Apophysomyces sp. BC1034]|nr:RNA polymerase II mediator complex subunit [Apophysomyces sp. BC1015]KAG0172385.1 RNA polymerase II mediator complex subunit [Apophysomyces sp. BC1021]KAG0185034.1 RNA polymerase II mediator complex subunit [Apophysomyces sp. BC1034]
MQTVDRIWFERGDWKDISESSLQKSIAQKEIQHDTENALATDQSKVDESASVHSQAQVPPGFDMMKLRGSVVNKLVHAKSEIDVALDVITILATQNKPGGAVKDLVLRPGSLNTTYVSKPKPTAKAQLESAQLTLGLKRQQQKAASEFLKTSALSLRRIVDDEQAFWEEALELRRNNWLMQSSGASSSTGNPASFRVQYGFTDVGSDFNEMSSGEMMRPDSAGNSDDRGLSKMQLSLPHSVPRHVVVSLYRSPVGRLGLDPDTYSEDMLGMAEEQSEDAIRQQPKDTLILPTVMESSSDVQKQLVSAQATVFDAELFAGVLSEAQALRSNVCIADDEVIVTIDGQIDLSIKKIQDSPAGSFDNLNTDVISTQRISAQTICLALRLLLIQRHRLNIWKTRARILSFNRKARQLLEAAAAVSISSSTAQGHGLPPSSSSKRLQQAPLAFRAPSQQQYQREPLTEIPVLSPVLTMSRFWILFDRVRQVVYETVSPFCGEGGLDMAVHYKTMQQTAGKSANFCDAYPSVGDLAVSLAITLMKGPSLHYALHQSGCIMVCMSQTTLALQSIPEFEAVLSREINLICLRIVCKEANDVIQRSSIYQSVGASEKSRFLWKVDDVEEVVNGSVWWSSAKEHRSHLWRNLHIKLVKKRMASYLPRYPKQPAYSLQLSLGPLAPLPSETRSVLFAKMFTKDTSSNSDALNFREKIKQFVENLLADAAGSTYH